MSPPASWRPAACERREEGRAVVSTCAFTSLGVTGSSSTPRSRASAPKIGDWRLSESVPRMVSR